MGTKEKIGALIILGGVALIGFYWFKKNKPTIASSQAKGLQALSDFYKTGGTDDTLIKGYTPPDAPQISLAQVDYTNMTPLKKSYWNNCRPFCISFKSNCTKFARC